MTYLPKDAHKLSDRQLAGLLFPKKALEQIKQDLEKKPKSKQPK